jgi:hypothetical protein
MLLKLTTEESQTILTRHPQTLYLNISSSNKKIKGTSDADQEVSLSMIFFIQ